MSESHFIAKPLSYTALPYAEQKARQKNESAKLKAAGFDFAKRYTFTDGNEQEKAVAKQACTMYARHWTEKSGVELEVCEGFFL